MFSPEKMKTGEKRLKLKGAELNAFSQLCRGEMKDSVIWYLIRKKKRNKTIIMEAQICISVLQQSTTPLQVGDWIIRDGQFRQRMIALTVCVI